MSKKVRTISIGQGFITRKYTIANGLAPTAVRRFLGKCYSMLLLTIHAPFSSVDGADGYTPTA
jgi:hypothetical protein